MEEKLKEILTLAEEAENALITGAIHRRGIEREPDEEQKRATLSFLRAVKAQASSGEILPSIEEKLEVMVSSYETLPPGEREPSFRCVASYKSCMSDASNLTEKTLCGIALAICFAKEVVPLA